MRMIMSSNVSSAYVTRSRPVDNVKISNERRTKWWTINISSL